MAYAIHTADAPARPSAPHRQTPPGVPVATIPAQAPRITDDSGLGLMLFVVFVTAVLLITGAVAFLALITAWWVLGLVFGVDILVTGAVAAVVFTVLGDGRLRSRGGEAAPSEFESSTEAPVRPRTVRRAYPAAA